MKLSKEQRDLLFFLTQDEWITGQQISSYFQWDKKKIHKLIDELAYRLESYCDIISKTKMGYSLVWKSEEHKNRFFLEYKLTDNQYNLNERTVILILELLFCNHYITMQELADRFYFSKTTIYDETTRIKRWLDRMNHLKLDVNPKHGLCILGKEAEKRRACAVLCQTEFLRKTHLSEDNLEFYENIKTRVRNIMTPYFTEKKISLSGERYHVLTRYIAMSLLRHKLGYILEEGYSFEIEKFEIIEMVEKEIEHTFNIWELREIYTFFPLECRDVDFLQDIVFLRDNLENNIAFKLQVKKEELFQCFSNISRFDTLFLPSSRVNHQTNYYDKEIIKNFLYEIHLVYQALQKICIWNPSRSDLLTLSAGIGYAISNIKLQSGISILLVGNQDFYLLDGIGMCILNYCKFIPSVFEVLPVYAFYQKSQEEIEKYDILFTTERNITLKYKNAVYISPILERHDFRKLSDAIEKYYHQYITNIVNQIVDEYRQYEKYNKITSIEEIIDKETFGKCTRIYSNRVLYLIGNLGTTFIRDISIENELIEEKRKIKRILFVSYDEVMFKPEIVSELLRKLI